MNAEERDWELIDRATIRWAGGLADPAALDRVLAGALRQVRASTPVTARLRWGWLVVRAQVPVVAQRLLAASLLVMMLGAAVAVASGRGWSQDVFVLFAPLAAAGGGAIVFRDDLGELAATLPAPPRLVLLARLAVVFGADLAATLLTSVAVAGRMHEALGALIGEWLGPMLLLATISLFVSVFSAPGAGIVVASALWFLRVVAGLDIRGGLVTPAIAAWIDRVWATTPVGLVAAAVLLAATVVVAPRRLAVAS